MPTNLECQDFLSAQQPSDMFLCALRDMIKGTVGKVAPYSIDEMRRFEMFFLGGMLAHDKFGNDLADFTSSEHLLKNMYEMQLKAISNRQLEIILEAIQTLEARRRKGNEND